MGDVRLTKEIHTGLKINGYKYFLITDVQLDPANGNKIRSISVRACKATMPAAKGCFTGIDDDMITSLLLDKSRECTVFVELFKTYYDKEEMAIA